jgi:hypothetical protein
LCSSLNELVIERHKARDRSTGALLADPVIDTLASAMRTSRENAEQIGVAAKTIMADATATPAANGVRVKNTALALAEKATNATLWAYSTDEIGDQIRRFRRQTSLY